MVRLNRNTENALSTFQNSMGSPRKDVRKRAAESHKLCSLQQGRVSKRQANGNSLHESVHQLSILSTSWLHRKRFSAVVLQFMEFWWLRRWRLWLWGGEKHESTASESKLNSIATQRLVVNRGNATIFDNCTTWVLLWISFDCPNFRNMAGKQQTE